MEYKFKIGDKVQTKYGIGEVLCGNYNSQHGSIYLVGIKRFTGYSGSITKEKMQKYVIDKGYENKCILRAGKQLSLDPSEYQEVLSYIIDKYISIDVDGIPKNKETKMVSKLQHLVNKNIPSVPRIYDGYDERGNLAVDTYICPNCNNCFEINDNEINDNNINYCLRCGQALDMTICQD